MIPAWLRVLSIAFLVPGALCVLVILADIVRHPQHTAIMNVVWPVTALFGWHWLVPEMFAAWVVDCLFAYAFGVVFQYLAIKPMRDLTPGAAMRAAIKADTLSLTSWQVGM